MIIYKVIAEFGLDRELDSVIFSDYKKAVKDAMTWFNNEDCDAVEIAWEENDINEGRFRTIRTTRIKRPF